jgi:hypothetical protein
MAGTTGIDTEETFYARPAARRAADLAVRLEQGARALMALAASLSDEQWRQRIPGDGRPIGVVVHHVASVYPLEIQLAQTIAGGQPVIGVTMEDVHKMNAAHAQEFAAVTRDTALRLLDRNSVDAASAIRRLTDEELARAVPASLYADAPVTCQFVLEDHAVRHSYHHLAAIRRTLLA